MNGIPSDAIGAIEWLIQQLDSIDFGFSSTGYYFFTFWFHIRGFMATMNNYLVAFALACVFWYT